MNIVALLIATFAVLPAVGLVAWVNHAMERTDDDLLSFVDFEGMHFEG